MEEVIDFKDIQVGDVISTPDLIGGVTGVLVEVEKLKEADDSSCLSVMTSFMAETCNIRTHRIKLAIMRSNSPAFPPGDVYDFWPPLGASWKKL